MKPGSRKRLSGELYTKSYYLVYWYIIVDAQGRLFEDDAPIRISGWPRLGVSCWRAHTTAAVPGRTEGSGLNRSGQEALINCASPSDRYRTKYFEVVVGPGVCTVWRIVAGLSHGQSGGGGVGGSTGSRSSIYYIHTYIPLVGSTGSTFSGVGTALLIVGGAGTTV